MTGAPRLPPFGTVTAGVLYVAFRDLQVRLDRSEAHTWSTGRRGGHGLVTPSGQAWHWQLHSETGILTIHTMALTSAGYQVDGLRPKAASLLLASKTY